MSNVLDLEHFKSLIMDKRSQEVIDQLPISYPEEFCEDTKTMLQVATFAAELNDLKVLSHFLAQYQSNLQGSVAFHDITINALRNDQEDVIRLVAPHWMERESLAGQHFVDYAMGSEKVEMVRLALSFTHQFWSDKLLVFGARHNAVDLVDIALAKGAKPDLDRYKPLSSAIVNACSETAQKLWPYLEKEPDPSVRQRIGLLMAAASVTNDDKLGYLNRSLEMAGSELEKLKSSEQMQEYTFRFVGTPSIVGSPSVKILSKDALSVISAFLSHKDLSAQTENLSGARPSLKKMM